MNTNTPKTAEAPKLSANTIRAGWRDTFSTNNPFCPCDLRSFTKAVRWAEHVLAAAPQPEAPVGASAEPDVLDTASTGAKGESLTDGEIGDVYTTATGLHIWGEELHAKIVKFARDMIAADRAALSAQATPVVTVAGQVGDEAEQDAFEKRFPMPSQCTRFKGGYSATEFNAWEAHKFCDRWDGWKAKAAALAAASSVQPADREELLGDAIRALIAGKVKCSDDLPLEKRPVHVSARRAWGAVHHLMQQIPAPAQPGTAASSAVPVLHLSDDEFHALLAFHFAREALLQGKDVAKSDFHRMRGDIVRAAWRQHAAASPALAPEQSHG